MKKVIGIGVNDCPGWSNNSGRANYNEYNYRVYTLWKGMLHRCYNPKFHQVNPTYKGCKVCVRWRTLSNFAEDIKQLPNYDLWKNNPNQLIALDKDSLGNGSMEYSPTTCCFLSIGENNKEMLGRNPLRNSKRVKATNLNTGEVREYLSTADTEKDGFWRGNVSDVCRGIRKHHKGWKFEYID